MAQSGYTPISLYYSSTATNAPTAGNLVNGELAINITDGKLYYKDNTGAVQVIASKAGNVNVSSFSAGTTGLTPSTATSGAITLAGTLNVANGGTGFTSLTAGYIPYGNGTSAFSSLAIGTSGQILTSTGTAPQWSTLSGVAVTTFSGGTTGLTPSTATSGAVTLAGTLNVANGGTGTTTLAAGSIHYGAGTSPMSSLAIGTSGYILQSNGSAPTWVAPTSVVGGAGGSNTQVQYNSSGSLAGSANMTFNGTTLTTANDASISGLTVGKGGGSGTNNVVVGNGALAATNTGGQTTAVGAQALAANTSGQYGVAVGAQALAANTTGSGNSGLGQGTLYTNTTGGNNTAVGQSALFSNTTASNNTAVGYQAGYGVTTGQYNTFLGAIAGYGGTALTTGSYSMYLGYNSEASSSSAYAEIVIGGAGVVGKGSSTGFISPNGGGVYQGNNSTLWSITSDQRIKKNIVDNTQGLAKILTIQVRNFEYRLPEEITEVDPKQAIDKQGIQLGAIAQELALVVPECVKQESTGIYTVDADPLIWYLVNAVKELKAEIDQLKGN